MPDTKEDNITVEITGALRDSYWYADMVGERFEVVEEGVIDHRYRLTGDEAERSLLIHPEDCKRIDG